MNGHKRPAGNCGLFTATLLWIKILFQSFFLKTSHLIQCVTCSFFRIICQIYKKKLSEAFVSVQNNEIHRKSTSYTLDVHPTLKKIELLLKASGVKTQSLQYICWKWHAKILAHLLCAIIKCSHAQTCGLKKCARVSIFDFILIAYFDHRAYDQLKQNATAAGRRHNSEGCYRQDLWWPQGQRSNHDGHTHTHTLTLTLK